jgi:site-specific DNA recombinase
MRHTTEDTISRLIRSVLAECPTPAKYIGYGRVSSKQQKDKGRSLDGQKLDIERWASDLNLVQHAYIQESHSGWKGTRPQFQREIIDRLPVLRASGVHFLVVYQLDRFARNVEYALNVLAQLTHHGIAVISVTDTLDYTTADGWQTFVNRLTSAEYYSRKLSQTMKVTRRREPTQHGHIVGNVSTGYRRTPNGGIEPDDRAHQQRMLFTLYATDLYSCQQLASTMNNHGWLAWNEQKQTTVPYTKWNVAEMLGNPVYIGKVRYKGTIYDGDHEPLIDRVTWEQVQAIRHRRTHARGTVIQKAGPFSGMLYCEECGGLMWQHNRSLERGYWSYECSTRYDVRGCNAKQIRSTILMQDVVRLLQRLRLTQAQKQRIVDRAALLIPQASVAPVVIDQSALNRLVDLYTSGLIDKATFEDRQRALVQASTSASVPEPLQAFDMQRAFTLLDNIAHLVQQATPAEQRAILQSLFARFWATNKHGLIAIQPQPIYMELLAIATNPCQDGEPGGVRFSMTDTYPQVWVRYHQPYQYVH